MEKLTKTQERELDIIKGYIEYGKQFNSAEELYNSLNYTCKWEDLKEDWQQKHIEDYERRLNNIALRGGNSNILRALEKKGYIEIIKDGKNNTDIVKLK